MRRGIWCPRHPDEPLIRTDLPNGKFDLRCPVCHPRKGSEDALRAHSTRAAGAVMTESQTTGEGEWWSAAGEREDARMVAARIRWFLNDARLLTPFQRRQFEIAAEDLEGFGNG